jgi:hypothetical protein
MHQGNVAGAMGCWCWLSLTISLRQREADRSRGEDDMPLLTMAAIVKLRALLL